MRELPATASARLGLLHIIRPVMSNYIIPKSVSIAWLRLKLIAPL
ncbi:MAG: hypothetical protein ABIP06_05955 [Pyrinomonadaceae bacterium]